MLAMELMFAGTMPTMAAYIDKIKVTSNGRVSLGDAAMRNLGLQQGDTLEVFYDEREKALVMKKKEQTELSATPDTSNKLGRRRKQDHGA